MSLELIMYDRPGVRRLSFRKQTWLSLSKFSEHSPCHPPGPGVGGGEGGATISAVFIKRTAITLPALRRIRLSSAFKAYVCVYIISSNLSFSCQTYSSPHQPTKPVI